VFQGDAAAFYQIMGGWRWPVRPSPWARPGTGPFNNGALVTFQSTQLVGRILKYYFNEALARAALSALLDPPVAGKPQKNPGFPWI